MTEDRSEITPADRRLFWACFVSLVATAFGFIIRALIIGDLQEQFGLSETQKGEILGVGLWPFAISIVLFSLVIDRIGYGRAMVFAFVCHVVSVVVTITADGYWGLYVGTFIVALGNGTVEAVINPVVATMFSRDKTKWLNILHAGWPGGLVLGGLLVIGLSNGPFPADWRFKVGLILIPVAIYGAMMLRCRFPVQERVQAGVEYRDMLREAGVLGALIVVTLIVREVGRVFAAPLWVQVVAVALLVGAFGAYTRALGRWMFALLLLIMLPLATTELGTDSWISDLMTPEMEAFGLQGGWVLVYTSAIMMLLRFFAGPIVHAISPLGLLATSSIVAALALFLLSRASGLSILLAATLFGMGKAFFWPTMLGVTAERFPRGGALTLNAMAGAGMLGVGVVGAAFLGNIQDREIGQQLRAQDPAVYASVVGPPKTSVVGTYRSLDSEKVGALPASGRDLVDQITAAAKKNALATVAVLPVGMLVFYLGLIVYFRARGGYRAEEIGESNGP